MLGSGFGFPQGLFLSLLLGLPLGCAHLKDSGQDEDLDHAVDLYWKATHWQDAIAGSVLVAPEVRSEWLHTRDKQEKRPQRHELGIQGEKIDKGGFFGLGHRKGDLVSSALAGGADRAGPAALGVFGEPLDGQLGKGGPLPFP